MYSFTMKNGNVTVLGQETEFSGELEFTDNLVITGKFEGKINATGNLKIGKTGICKVSKMTADSILVAGSVTGDIEAKSKVEMCSGSKITGDVASVRLRIDDDVDFHGQVTMLDALPDVDLFSLSASEYKQACLAKEQQNQ
ncbi:MAG: polymer-forming cytoskeletal protein [Spirochaetaceae bacterium]|nr:polymer-forming cytoskeletal protein [Spirochaetaceae bacterium]MBO5236273.1 polymer-forming cytoskeletal protein [Spirochaetaceae bacterium]